MAVTVKHLLEQNYMARVRVACGEDRLANRVEGLTFFRDACQYGVSRNNLVLAVEEELKGRGTEELDQLAETFLNQKVSAVIVKTEAEHSDEEKRLTGVFAGHRLPLLFFSGDIFYSSLIRGIEYDLIYSQGYNMSNPYAVSYTHLSLRYRISGRRSFPLS